MGDILRVFWKMNDSTWPTFYKEVGSIEQAEFVLEVLSEVSTFLGHHNCTGGVEEWNQNAHEWKRVHPE